MPRPRSAVVLLAVATATSVGCGAAREAPRPAAAPGRERTGAYVEAARRALEGPAEFASLVAPALRTSGRLPDPALARTVAERARATVAELRSVPLVDRRLRVQRKRLADGLERLLGPMEVVISGADRGDRATVTREGMSLMRAMRELPSVVSR